MFKQAVQWFPPTRTRISNLFPAEGGLISIRALSGQPIYQGPLLLSRGWEAVVRRGHFEKILTIGLPQNDRCIFGKQILMPSSWSPMSHSSPGWLVSYWLSWWKTHWHWTRWWDPQLISLAEQSQSCDSSRLWRPDNHSRHWEQVVPLHIQRHHHRCLHEAVETPGRSWVELKYQMNIIYEIIYFCLDNQVFHIFTMISLLHHFCSSASQEPNTRSNSTSRSI